MGLILFTLFNLFNFGFLCGPGLASRIFQGLSSEKRKEIVGGRFCLGLGFGFGLVRGGFVSGLVAKIEKKFVGTQWSRPTGGSHEAVGRPPCVLFLNRWPPAAWRKKAKPKIKQIKHIKQIKPN